MSVTGPITGGRRGYPFAAYAGDLGALGYVGEEFSAKGDTARYRPVGELTPDGKWTVDPNGTVPYETRLLVWRPENPAHFNGTVVMEWMNVSVGWELSTLGTISRDICRDGFVFVTASCQRIGLEGCAQAGRAIGPNRSRSGVDPLGGLDVRRVIASGNSGHHEGTDHRHREHRARRIPAPGPLDFRERLLAEEWQTVEQQQMPRWTLDDIPDQSGRRVIVTGANSGIGFETAKALAARGAEVALACRSAPRGQDAVDRILKELPDASARFEQLDLSDLDDVEAFAARFVEGNDRLDLLILNAGVMVPPESRTKQGFELQLGVNHLGHFALAGAQLPLVQRTEGSRVVVVSSTAAFRGAIDFDDLNFDERGYSRWQAYGQSKLANQLFARELQRRLRATGSSVLVTAAHPGWTMTNLQRTSTLASFLNPFVGMKPPQGALPTLRAATDPMATDADYYGPDGFLQMRGYPVRIDMVKQARDAGVARRLWAVSEELTGVRYELPSE